MIPFALSLRNKLLDAVQCLDGQVVRGRYAPSPSGPLHLGNIQSALLAWLQARLVGGQIALRIDDLDTPRVKTGSAAQMQDDLAWLGFDWDGPVIYQSARLGEYEAAFERLQQAEKIYPCRCSRAEILSAASAPHEAGATVRYPGTCRQLGLNHFDAAQTLAWRFNLPDEEVVLKDSLAGPFSQQLQQEVGDVVVKRKDGLFAYQLATVVDDIDLGITDVVRGEDLLDSAPRQVALFEALGHAAPRFWHGPLKLDAQGQRMAKRNGSDSIAPLRQQGISAPSIIGLLAYEMGLIGENESLSPQAVLQKLKEN